MLQEIRDGLESLLGIGESSLDLGADEMILRAVIVYIFTLLMIRIGHKRFLGQHTAFDIVMGIILGSVVSRAITGSAAFLPSLLAGVTLVALHYVLSAAAYRSHRLGSLFKGDAQILVDDGEIQAENLHSSHISRRDLLQALRENANLDDPDQVNNAWLERSGIISIIPKAKSPQIIEVSVEDGVQTVRLRIE